MWHCILQLGAIWRDQEWFSVMETEPRKAKSTHGSITSILVANTESLSLKVIHCVLKTCGASLTSTENAVQVYFDSPHNPAEEVWPGEDVPSVVHVGGWTAAGQDLDLQYIGGEDQLLYLFKYIFYDCVTC